MAREVRIERRGAPGLDAAEKLYVTRGADGERLIPAPTGEALFETLTAPLTAAATSVQQIGEQVEAGAAVVFAGAVRTDTPAQGLSDTAKANARENAEAAARFAGMRSSREFGDRGPGYDNTAAINDMIAEAKNMNGRRGVFIAPWDSEVQVPLNFGDLEGVTISGVPGQSRLRGGADYALVTLGHMQNVLFDGVGFVSGHASAVEDGGKSIVYSFQKLVKNVAYRRCYFSNPNSFTSALTFYARLNAGNPDYDPSSIGAIDGLEVSNCTFENIGRICMTLMNRSDEADGSRYLRNVRLIDNIVRRAGAQAPAITSGQQAALHGMFVSMDGCGESIAILRNYLQELQGLGIEIVNQVGRPTQRWSNVTVADNTFRDFSRGLHMLSIDDGNGTAGGMTGLTIERNRPVGDVTGARHSNLFGLDGTCVLRDNHFPGHSTDQAAVIRRAGKIISEKNRYVQAGNTGRYALLIESGAIRSVRDRFDCQGAGTYAVIRFLSAAAQGSILTEATIVKGAAGVLVDQVTGAAANYVRSYSTDTAVDVQTSLMVTMAADADFSLTQGAADIINYDYVRINQPASGPLTAPRTITINPREGFNPTISNQTTQTLLIAGGTGTTFLFPNQRVSFRSIGASTLNPTNTGYYSSVYNAGVQGFFLGLQRIYQDTNGALRNYTPTGANPNPGAVTDGRPVGLVASGTLASLPTTGLTAGQIAYATNARALTSGGTLEATGAGTGASVTWSGSAWKIAGTNIVAST